MWTKYYSKVLEMKYAVNSETGEIMTEDKVVYSQEDLEEILKKGEITKEIHELQKLKYFFNGTLVEEFEQEELF
jgi:hypothetical protein